METMISKPCRFAYLKRKDGSQLYSQSGQWQPLALGSLQIALYRHTCKVHPIFDHLMPMQIQVHSWCHWGAYVVFPHPVEPKEVTTVNIANVTKNTISLVPWYWKIWQKWSAKATNWEKILISKNHFTCLAISKFPSLEYALMSDIYKCLVIWIPSCRNWSRYC